MKRVAAILFASAAITCSPAAKIPSQKPPLVEIPSAGSDYQPGGSREQGKKHCFTSGYSNPLYDLRYIPTIGTLPLEKQAPAPRTGIFGEGEELIDQKETVRHDLKPDFPVIEDYHLHWRINRISDGSIEIGVYEKRDINEYKIQDLLGRELTADERNVIAAIEGAGDWEASFSVKLSDSVEIMPSPVLEPGYFTSMNYFKAHLRSNKISSFCFQTRGRNRALIEME